MKTPPIQTCEWCGNPFQNPWMKPSRFCSTKCRDKEKHNRPENKAKRRIRSRELYHLNKADRSAYLSRWRHQNRLKVLQDRPWLSLLASAKHSAAQKSLQYTLDETWARSRWTGYCEVSGLPFSSPEERVGYKNRNFCPSIDRIDPNVGYLKYNCRFVLWAVNSLKRDGTEDEMYLIAKAIVDNMSPSPAVGIDCPAAVGIFNIP